MWPDDSDLAIEVQAAFGADLTADPATWSWTDLSSRLRAETIRIRAGKSGGAARVSPGTCAVMLDNPDGALTPQHPMSPYWPNVQLGTPLRVRVQWDGVWRDRFSGFADQWEPTFLPTTTPGEADSAVRVTASGILRRLSQGNPRATSALRRTLAASGVLAYWPGEDATDATVAGSAIPGHAPLTVTGVAEFKPIDEWVSLGYTVRYGTAALADLSGGGQIAATVPADVTAATATGWTVNVVADVSNRSGLSSDIVVADIATPGGTYVRWQLVVLKTTVTRVIAYTAAGSSVIAAEHDNVIVPLTPHNFSVWQNGANISVGYFWDSVDGYWATGSIAGTLAGITSVAVNTTAVTNTTPMPFGHIAVWAGHGLPVADFRDGDMIRALLGYGWAGFGTAHNAATGEPATRRLARLCAEDGIDLDVPAVDPADEVMMGTQQPGTRLDLYQECVDADVGVLYESGFSLGYLPRVHRYNRPVDLTVDLAAYKVTGRVSSDVLKPVYDDQGVRNELTVERTDGSSVVVADLASQARHGVYDDSVTLNLASDAQLPDHAGWRMHLGAVDELREATIPLDLAANPELVDGWLSCGVGSRIVRANPPAQYGAGSLDRLVEGWTETIGPRSWMVQVTPSPATPWDVAEVDGEQRPGADGSLTIGLAEGAMSFLLSSTPENGVWTEDPADMPLDIRVGGERVTASSIARSFVDTFTRTVSGGWGGEWASYQGNSVDASVNGSAGLIILNTVGDERHMTTDLGARTQDVRLWTLVPVTPAGAGINVGLLLRYVDASNYVWADAQVNTDSTINVRLIKRVAGVATQLVSVPSGVAHSTSVPLAIRAEVSGSLLRARVWLTSGLDPGAWQASVVDSALPDGTRGGAVARRMTGNTNGTVNVQFDNVSVQQPQLVSLSARGVNGVTRSWPAGTEVDAWAPAIASL